MKHPRLISEIQKKSPEVAPIILAQTAKAADPKTARFSDFGAELDNFDFNELHAKGLEVAVNIGRLDNGGSPYWKFR